LESLRCERWLTPAEFTQLFRDAGLFPLALSTLRARAAAGKITCSRTLGGHRRYPESEARALVEAARPKVTA